MASLPPGHPEPSPTSPGSGSTGRADFFKIWLATVPMLVITVASITANGAVLYMFFSRQGLRRYKNIYVASLALADFLVGLCLPVKMAFDLNYSWPSKWPCRVFQSVRVTLAYVSFLSILLIVLDKWRAVHYPVSYRGRKNKGMAVAAVVIVWLVGFTLYAIPLVWWDDMPLPQKQQQLHQHLQQHQQHAKYRKLITTTTTTTPTTTTSNLLSVNLHTNSNGGTLQYSSGNRSVSSSSSGGSSSGSNNLTKSLISGTDYDDGSGKFCFEGYHLQFNLSILSTAIFYIIPLIFMFCFNMSVYFKIKWRKSVEVQRSTSVTDTYFMTLKKPAMDMDNCGNSGADDPAKEALLKNSDNKPINKHLAVAARGERRHSSLPAISPVIKGRTSSGRRVSMPEGNATGGGCRYVGRKWSGCVSNMSGNTSPNPMANLGPRLQNEDLVHDILLKKDKTVARCLCLMLAVMVACWLPHVVVSMVNAHCWCIRTGTLIATSWLCLLSHGVNPFLYVIMMAQFKNVLKQWLLVERVHAFKMRDTLILKNLQRKIANEEDSNNKDKSPLPSTKEDQFHLPDIEKNENSSV